MIVLSVVMLLFAAIFTPIYFTYIIVKSLRERRAIERMLSQRNRDFSKRDIW